MIPTEATWQPTEAAAAAAVAYVTVLFSVPGSSVDEVTCDFFDKVTLIDSGVNTERVTCPNCGAEIDLDWVFDVVGQRADDLGTSVL